MQERTNFVVMVDWWEMLEELTDEQKGRAMSIMFGVARGEDCDLSGEDLPVKIAMKYIKTSMERMLEEYDAKCRKNAENGRKGGRPRKKSAEAEKPNGFFENREKPDGFFENPTETETETETEQSKGTASRTSSGKPDRLHPKTREVSRQAITHLNSMTGADFKPTTRATLEKVSARLNEGAKASDFTRVIDNKVADWLNDKKMRKYLRPLTLFGAKFESYLNEGRPKARDPAYGEEI